MSSEDEVVVTAVMTAKPEHGDAVEESLRQLVAEVHAEPGCLLYTLNRTKDTFVFIEKWESADALKVHGAGAAVAASSVRNEGLLEGRAVITVLHAVPAGDPVKGRL